MCKDRSPIFHSSSSTARMKRDTLSAFLPDPAILRRLNAFFPLLISVCVQPWSNDSFKTLPSTIAFNEMVFHNMPRLLGICKLCSRHRGVGVVCDRTGNRCSIEVNRMMAVTCVGLHRNVKWQTITSLPPSSDVVVAKHECVRVRAQRQERRCASCEGTS